MIRVQKILIRTVLLSGVVVLSANCSLVRKLYPPVKTKHYPEDKLYAEEIDERYQEGMTWYQRGEYEKAIDTFHLLNQEYPTSKYAQKSDYYTGRSYHSLGAYDRAIEKYRTVVGHRSSDEWTRTQSLYYLSFAYEIVGDQVNALASLSDAFERQDLLDREIRSAEAPARLASLYARVGNEDLANRYFEQASKGIHRLRMEARQGDVPKWLPKTLFFMGNMSLGSIKSRNFSAAIRPLKKAQLFLLQSAEINDPDWSMKASDRIIDLYRDLWTLVLEEPVNSGEDLVLLERERQERQWKMSHQLLENLEHLRLARVPVTANLDAVRRIFVFAEQQNAKINEFLQQPRVGTGLTPEALEREGIKRRGRVRDTKTVLDDENPPLIIKDPNL